MEVILEYRRTAGNRDTVEGRIYYLEGDRQQACRSFGNAEFSSMLNWFVAAMRAQPAAKPMFARIDNGEATPREFDATAVQRLLHDTDAAIADFSAVKHVVIDMRKKKTDVPASH